MSDMTHQNPPAPEASGTSSSQPDNPSQATAVPLDLGVLLQVGMVPIYSALYPLIASQQFAATIDAAIEAQDYDLARRACRNLTEGTMRSFVYVGARLGLTPEQTQQLFDRITDDFYKSQPAPPSTGQ